MVSIRIVWIQFEGSLELFFRALEVPIKIEIDRCERGMRFGEGIVYIDRLFCCGSRLSCSLTRWQTKCLGRVEAGVRIGQTSIGQRVVTVCCNCLFEILHTLTQSFRSPLVLVISTLYIQLILLCIVGVSL